MAALWTGPFFFFFSDEFSNSMLFNIFLVLNHTHGIFRIVTLVQAFHPGAWEFIAIVAKSGFELLSLFAHSYPAAYARF